MEALGTQSTILKILLMSPPKKKPLKRPKSAEADQEKSGKKEPLVYEDLSDLIDSELKKRRSSWFLSSIAWLDFDDVCQIIRAHIYNKWDQWDQERPIKPWLNKLVANQLKNILRNYYSNFARPCLNCPFNTDGELHLCSFTRSGLQDPSCPLYEKWNKTKRHAYNVKITLALDNHIHEIDGGSESYLGIDLEVASQRLIQELKKELNSRQFQAFELLYIKSLTDEEAAAEMGFKSTEAGRKAGYKQIKNLKKLLKDKAAKILKTKGIAFLEDLDEPE